MKRNDTGEFCILYVEPTDDRASLLQAIIGQNKPVVIMVAQKARVFQHPEDFTALKHVKRQLDLPIMFVISHGERLMQLTSRNGFPAYSSMDALIDAWTMGARQRTFTRTTVPLSPLQQDASFQRTSPLPSPPPLVAPPPSPVSPTPKKERAGFPVALIVLTILALAFAGLGSFLMLFHALPTDASVPPVAVGHISFLSSNQLSENSSQGINDEVQINLSNLQGPAPQKIYYAWLLGDKSQGEAKTIFLGVLQVNKGSAHLLYPGDEKHTNLLEMTSRFLVTEEDASMTPIAPSPDYSTWRYYGAFSQTPIASTGTMNGTDHFSFLDHLRHLLASDPMLNDLELPGGLNSWLYRNTGKILEWTGSTRDQWEEGRNIAFVRRQTVRTLAYLDGLSYVQQDIPSNTPLLVNERLARVGLVEVNYSNQDPPCYLNSIIFHLNGLIHAGGSTTTLRTHAAELVTAMSNVRVWLEKVRRDAQQIMKMTDEQLVQPSTLSLLNDMIDNANHAYVGQLDPTTGEMREGVIWIHEHMQSLATLEVTTYTADSQSIQMIQDTKHLKVVRYMHEDKL